MTITIYITPGRTAGTLSFLIPVKDHGVPHMGRGASTDIIEASAKAYVDGGNKLARVAAATP